MLRQYNSYDNEKHPEIKTLVSCLKKHYIGVEEQRMPTLFGEKINLKFKHEGEQISYDRIEQTLKEVSAAPDSHISCVGKSQEDGSLSLCYVATRGNVRETYFLSLPGIDLRPYFKKERKKKLPTAMF